MKEFLCDDFLLNNETAKILYHEYAKEMPIIDYHNHLLVKEIYEDKIYENITKIWLYGDHYKWRAMRSNGLTEEKITAAETTDYDKFKYWAQTVPYTFANPLFHWTHLELKRYFGIHKILNEKTCDDIWKQVNEKLNNKALSTRELIVKMNVEVLCTTDDPTDSLEYHIKLKEEEKRFRVLPTFRPDKAINIELDWFTLWLNDLEKVVAYEIDTIDKLKKALEERIEFFDAAGCKLSDHALDEVLFAPCSDDEAAAIFQKGLSKKALSLNEIAQYKGYIMTFLGKQYAKKGWIMQLHIGALRNNSERRLRQLGPDTGFDSINDSQVAQPLAHLLNKLDDTDELPKTILYNLNPSDNYVIGTMIGNFQGGGIAGKIQFGTGWWFNDQKEGMIEQFKALSNLGLLSKFVGMLTDSRSFLSFPRHEYFRRILCNYMGEIVENGEFPNDIEFLGQMTKDICYFNAKKYFDF